VYVYLWHVNFNPRAYVRHDYLLPLHYYVGCNFNPRAYVRHDAIGWIEMILIHISIHVPT